jgi:vancomycin resistance protein YoaR
LGYDVSLASRQRSRAMSFAAIRFGLVVVLTLAALIAVASILLLFYGWTHNGTAFQGVTVADVDLSGLSQQQAAARISDRIQSTAPKQIALAYNGQTWTVPASTLGISYDANDTAARALKVGHSGSLWVQTHDWLTTLSSGEDVPVSYTLNEDSAFAALQGVAGTVTRPAQNAAYVFDSNGSLQVDSGKDGVAIDVAATIQSIRNSVAHLSSESIEIKTQPVEPAINDDALQPGLEQAEAMVSQPLVLTDNGTQWAISPNTLREMLVVNPNSSESGSVAISSSALASYISQIADQVHTNGKNAGVRLDDNGKFVVVASTDGQSLDAKKTANDAIDALLNGKHQVEVAVTDTPAQVVDADARDAVAKAEEITSQPISLTWDGGNQDLTADQMASILAFTPQPDKSPKIAVGVNTDAVSALLDSLRSKIEVPAKDANLRYLNGAVTVVSQEQAGTSLDVGASAKAIETALSDGSHSVTLTTTPVQPQITAAMASTISVPDKLASGQTYYGGSVANRAFNVNLAVERVNGALIPPGATFSFDGTVGAVDTAHGYKLGYGIVGTSNGSVSTVPSVGGGICQVATTLFHAAFWAGMPIVQRSWHLYWIPLYGQAPSGITGLDATVDTDVGLDLKFKNTTDHWLAVVASADGTWVRFELRGTDPGWKVNVDDPVVSNVVKADTGMQYEKSDQLAAGTSVLVEHAEDGFDVVVHRQVVKDGNVIDDLTLKSHYLPSANVTLQGTGT